MSHSITCKLNKDARKHDGANGTTFFVNLGEKNYNFKTKENEWTNYEAALFAKDAQVQFYADTLVEGSVIEVSGTGLLLEVQDDPQYKPRLHIQDARLGFVYSQSGAAPAQQQAPQQRAQMQQAPQKMAQPAPQTVDHSNIVGQYMNLDQVGRNALWETLRQDQRDAIMCEFG